MSLWFVSMCTRYFGQGTEYVLRTTHPNWALLDNIPMLSTRCIEALTRSHPRRCPCAFKVPFTKRYPAFGILALFLWQVHQVLPPYMYCTNYGQISCFFAILRNGVARDTPHNFAIVFTDSPVSSRWTRCSMEISILSKLYLWWSYKGCTCWFLAVSVELNCIVQICQPLCDILR